MSLYSRESGYDMFDDDEDTDSDIEDRLIFIRVFKALRQ